MLGLAVGLLCGALELFLLSRLTYALTHGGSVTQMALLFFMKFLVLAGAALALYLLELKRFCLGQRRGEAYAVS